MTDTDLVKEFADILCKYVDCRREFAESAGYALISSALGYFFKCPWVPKDSSKPNVYIVLSSDPGLFRRSNIQSSMIRVFKTAMKDFFVDLLKNQPENVGKSDIELEELATGFINTKVMLYGGGSPEGVCDHISNAKPTKMFHIHSTEFGSTLAKMFGDGRCYEEGLSVLYSLLYYGEGGTIPLSTRGKNNVKRTVPEGLYVTLFVGMQELEEYLRNPKAIKQGFFRRILVVYFGKNDDPAPWKPYIRNDKEDFYEELDRFAKKLLKEVNRVREYVKKNYEMQHEEIINLLPSDEIINKINSYDEQINGLVRANRSDTNLAKQSYAEILTKLTFIRQIGMCLFKETKDDKGTQYQVEISTEAFDLSEKFLQSIGSKVDEALDNIGVKEHVMESTQSMDDKVFDFIARYPEGVTKSFITGKKRWDSCDTTASLQRLVEFKKISVESVETGGRSAQKFRIVKT
jgi:hypothetical protein